ncbi:MULTISPECIES: SDR family NAD(P)-dependent oxidoreductase [unclassified Streptosporangium]|uniref:SDR family NAD(P)-dependent oxidoreductase n=1 Tax=Streptosporangium sp. NPDC005286 TaxID=3154463 RepID=UPI0033B7CC2D
MPEGPIALDFHDLVVVVTGAGAGLGRQYALDFAAAGARVVVNARRAEVAKELVDRIETAGGTATTAVTDARNGAAIVDTAIDTYGRIDALVVNAGHVRDRTFGRMSEEEWTEIVDVHLGGAYTATAAAWPHMVRQGHGRIVLTTSSAGLHGNLGQANYAAAKAAIIGLAKALAIEGQRHGVLVNAIAPMAHTDMTDRVFDDELRAGLPAASVSPFVLALAHPVSTTTGSVIETGGGWAAEMRWQRSAGVRFAAAELTPAAVLERWPAIADFTTGADYPASTSDSLATALGHPTDDSV